MRVHLNFNPSRNTLINSSRVNASFAKYHKEDQKSGISLRNDRVTLSPQGRLMSVIENLTRQKQSLIDRRNSLVESTLNDGGKIEDIKDELKSYKKQIETIEKQITSAYAQQTKQCAEPGDSKKTAKTDHTRTKEQMEAEHLNDLAAVFRDLKHSEMLSASKDHAEGEARVKESEAVIGNVHLSALESKALIGVNVDDMIETESDSISRKEREAGQLHDKASELALLQGEELKESRETLKESQKTPEAAQKTPEISQKTPEISQKTPVAAQKTPEVSRKMQKKEDELPVHEKENGGLQD